MRKSRAWSGGVWLLALGLFVNASCNSQSLEHQRMIEACEQLRIGDTEQTVQELMGEPMKVESRRDTSGRGKLLTYPTPTIVPSGPHIYLDESGQIEEITCRESHHLIREKKSSS